MCEIRLQLTELRRLAGAGTCGAETRGAPDRELQEKQREIERLRAELAQREAELRGIKASLGWRLLSRYGRVKYRYLLPVYRLLRLPHDPAAAIVKPAAPPAPARQEGFYDRQLDALLERAAQARGVVVFLSSVAWDISLTQRPHHLARELIRHGFLSIYDNSAYDVSGDGFVEREPGLFIFSGPRQVLHRIPAPIIWAFTYNVPMAEGFASDATLVYDLIDDFSIFQLPPERIEENHRQGLTRADLVLAVARRLVDEARPHRPDTLYVPNGVDYDHFAGQTSAVEDDLEVQDLLRRGAPIAGYYGAIAEWFDYEMLTQVARARRDWTFLLMGTDYDRSISRRGRILLNEPNVRYVGKRLYRILPKYLQAFDVAMIPFVINDVTEATSPLKLYEYFAGGKPVVATPMSECETYPEVHIARDAQEFSAALDRALAESRCEEARERLRAIARANSWAARVEEVLEHVEWLRRAKARPVERSEPRAAANGGLTAEELARRFASFRNGNNGRFFEALTRHFAGSPDHPRTRMHFEFAVTTTGRGAQVADLLARRVQIRGRRYLDVGCAHGGFLVAFAQRGAEVTGVDINEALLRLARCNLEDHNLRAPLYLKDATQREAMEDFAGQFHIVTCNDVIEHVQDPRGLARNIAGSLVKGGVAFFSIPNGLYPQFVISDGHFQLFGITLLDFAEARSYYHMLGLGNSYNVYNYLTFEEYSELFKEAGLQLELMDESLAQVSVQGVLSAARALRQAAREGLNQVPEPLRDEVRQRLEKFLDELHRWPRATRAEERDFLIRYGISFWNVLARKPA